MLDALWRKARGTKVKEERTHEEYFSLDLIASLVLTSIGEFSFEDAVKRITTLRQAVPFEIRDGPDRVLSSETEVRGALPSLLGEGLCNGWIEAVTMRYPDRCRKDIPIRVRELLADSPELKDTLDKILAQIELLSAQG